MNHRMPGVNLTEAAGGFEGGSIEEGQNDEVVKWQK